MYLVHLAVIPVFKNIREKYDGILCLYHDQALSPIKTLDFFQLRLMLLPDFP